VPCHTKRHKVCCTIEREGGSLCTRRLGFLLEEPRRRLFPRRVRKRTSPEEIHYARRINGDPDYRGLLELSQSKSSYSRGTRLGGFLSFETGNWRDWRIPRIIEPVFPQSSRFFFFFFFFLEGDRGGEAGSATRVFQARQGPEGAERRTWRIAHATDGAFPDSRGNQAASRANHGTNEEEMGIRTAGVRSGFSTDRG